jgi:zinc protease
MREDPFRREVNAAIGAPISSHLLEFRFPEIRRRKLSNGLYLILIEQHDLPKIYVRLGLSFGTKNDPVNKAGLSQLLANTLKKGTVSQSYQEIIDKVEYAGGDLDAAVNEDFFFIYGEFLKENICIGMEVMSDILLRPSFPVSEIEKERFKLLADLENEKSSPDFLASRRLNKVLLAPHPYCLYKTAASLQSIHQKDFIDFHQNYFHPDQSVLIIGGDINEPEIHRLVDSYFNDWPEKVITPVVFDSPTPITKRSIHLVNRPGSHQSNILMGNIIFHRGHPEFEKMLVMNKILGGGGSGKLFLHLREEKGYTYGAYSSLQAFRETGVFSANAEVRTEVTGEALQAFFEQFKLLQHQPVSEEELYNAQRYLKGIFPLQNETAASIAALALKQLLYGLGENYWDEYLDKIGQVNQTDIMQMAQKYVRQDEMIVVVVGDANQLIEQVKDFGTVQIYDLDDNLVNETNYI